MTGPTRSSAAAGGAAAAAPVGSPSRSLSSRAIRAAPLRPIPGGLLSVARSSAATAARSWSTVRTASTAWAVRGPMPVTDCSTSNAWRSSSSANPNSVSESSRTTSAVAIWAAFPDSQARSRVRGPQSTAQAHAADVEHGVVRRDRGDGPADEGDHRAPPARGATRGIRERGGSGHRQLDPRVGRPRARDGRSPAPGHRWRPPAGVRLEARGSARPSRRPAPCRPARCP